MPELPDVVVYLERIGARVVGKELEGVRLRTPFVLRTFDPPISSVAKKKVIGVRRVGKRLALALEGDLFVVIHLMIAGRLKWIDAARAPIPNKVGHAAFDFASSGASGRGATMILTEASMKKRAAIHVVRGEAALHALDKGGVEPLQCDLETFRAALTKENHTLKRTLTDPRLFSGIGNAYSDEILHMAKLSPVKLTNKMTDEEIGRLFDATKKTLELWTDRLRKEVGDGWPEKVTAFREEMAVHGKYGKPCPVCASPVQRIKHAENETNYCATCQTGGKLLADRALSRLLREDWPRTLEDLEEMKEARISRT